jgi:acetyl esterase/lipase
MEMPGTTKPNRMVRNVVIPTVTMLKPGPGTANGTSLIVAPGGAFSFLMIDHEGYDMARWLAQQGVTAFVLKYRVAHTPENDADMAAFLQNLFRVLPHPGPTVETPPVGTEAVEQARTWAEEDGRQAIRFVRQHAAEWGVSPNRIGIAGFSADGGVVMGAVMQHDSQSWPDFAAPIYAGYRTATPVPSMRLHCSLRSPMTTSSSRRFPEQDSTRPGMRLADRQSSMFSPKESTASE